jgi:hypothetical protein
LLTRWGDARSLAAGSVPRLDGLAGESKLGLPPNTAPTRGGGDEGVYGTATGSLCGVYACGLGIAWAWGHIGDCGCVCAPILL